MADELNNKIEIELLKKDVHTMSTLLTKFDTALEKMQEIASSLSRMVSLQEQRLENQETATKDIQSAFEMRRIEHNAEIKELHIRITTVNNDLSQKIDDTEKKILDEIKSLRTEIKGENKGIGSRLASVEMWKYAVVVVIMFLVFLISNNFITFKQLLIGN